MALHTFEKKLKFKCRTKSKDTVRIIVHLSQTKNIRIGREED
jgi:hypothetical protein